jgi:dipeptidase D
MIPMIPNQPSAVIIEEKFSNEEFKTQFKQLEKHKIWTNFAAISGIYRESGHNKEISEYLKYRFLKEGFMVDQKTDGTILAYRGLNTTQNNAIILQAHMDMVAISKNGDAKTPIKFKINDNWIYANERTLGADDGIGVAAILAIAEDERFKNYPLEMIITSDEETTMAGAKGLSAEDFKGKHLINLDSEEIGVITKGCAGMSAFKFDEKIKTHSLDSDNYTEITVKIDGARGGHSSTVNDKTLNPILVLLNEIKNIPDIKLASFSGGERFNAIPRDASATILAENKISEQVVWKLNSDLSVIKQNKTAENPDLNITITSKAALKSAKYIDTDFQKKLLNNLILVPSTLISTFCENNCAKTSQNFSILNINDSKIHIEIMGRSADKKEALELQEKTSDILSKIFEKPIKVSETNPIWEPKDTSKLQLIAINTYNKITNNNAKIQVEHGGLEPASFSQKMPELDQISIGPTLEEPHSIQERLEISTVMCFYDWLCAIIDSINNNQ